MCNELEACGACAPRRGLPRGGEAGQPGPAARARRRVAVRAGADGQRDPAACGKGRRRAPDCAAGETGAGGGPSERRQQPARVDGCDEQCGAGFVASGMCVCLRGGVGWKEVGVSQYNIISLSFRLPISVPPCKRDSVPSEGSWGLCGCPPLVQRYARAQGGIFFLLAGTPLSTHTHTHTHTADVVEREDCLFCPPDSVFFTPPNLRALRAPVRLIILTLSYRFPAFGAGSSLLLIPRSKEEEKKRGKHGNKKKISDHTPPPLPCSSIHATWPAFCNPTTTIPPHLQIARGRERDRESFGHVSACPYSLDLPPISPPPVPHPPLATTSHTHTPNNNNNNNKRPLAARLLHPLPAPHPMHL